MRGHPRPRASSSCRIFLKIKTEKSAKKNLDSALHANLQEELTDEDLEGNHDANHREVECQRSAPQRTTNSDLGKKSWEKTSWTSNTTTTRNWNVNGVLQKKNRQHFQQFSTICGSRRTAREGQDEHEILGTAMACSAIGRSKRRNASITLSTICGTGASSI